MKYAFQSAALQIDYHERIDPQMSASREKKTRKDVQDTVTSRQKSEQQAKKSKNRKIIRQFQ